MCELLPSFLWKPWERSAGRCWESSKSSHSHLLIPPATKYLYVCLAVKSNIWGFTKVASYCNMKQPRQMKKKEKFETRPHLKAPKPFSLLSVMNFFFILVQKHCFKSHFYIILASKMFFCEWKLTKKAQMEIQTQRMRWLTRILGNKWPGRDIFTTAHIKAAGRFNLVNCFNGIARRQNHKLKKMIMFNFASCWKMYIFIYII